MTRLLDWLFTHIGFLERYMSAQTQALKQAVASLASTADAAVAQASTLKSKLDAAIADNVAKAAQIAQL